ncbi:MAG: UbiA prenyltransferase family protein [Chitinophagaceae bacterium]|nr:UbiA prenyltransferase family protein [Chitinophagaceae bacterium]
MLRKSTITLLRLPFSFFLMPVFFLALSQVQEIDYGKALLVFVILHLIMYPASNGYNSYMDKDEESIGILEKPPVATKELFYLTLLLDGIAVVLSFMVNGPFALCIIANILASRAYSYRGIRLKKYPVTGFLTVIVFQGAITYYMVYTGSSAQHEIPVPWMGMLISSFLFGGFYPLTQIYQHQQDLRDGVRTISYALGYMGTFLFTGIMYALAEILLFIYFNTKGQPGHFLVLQLFFLPVVGYFFFWWKRVHESRANASFRYCMRMNMIAAICTNTAFILFNIMNHTGRHLF